MTPKARSRTTDRLARATSILPLILFLAAAARIPALAAGKTWRFSLDWAPSLGIHLSFLFDGLSVFFVLIVTGIGFFVTLYAVTYLHGHSQTGRFFFFLHAFMISMLGLVCADNAICLFVFWEMTTLFSFLLIGFDHEKEASRKAARQALLVTGAGGLALLVAFLLMEQAAGTFEISRMVPVAGDIKNHTLYLPILVLIFLGAFTKSAQFPFHFWLPNAMAAPAPVSAFLHSATMVKGGIYLLARLHPVLGGTTPWMATLVIVGAVTAIFGAVTALGQTDLKKILAYTTLTGLGIMTLLLGGETHPSLVAAMTFLLVHALYKSALFLAAGIVDHQTGTRDIRDLGGLMRPMPFTAAAVFAACLSMAGFPLFFGFIGKEIMYQGTLAEAMMPELATFAAVFANGFMTAVAGILMMQPFIHKKNTISGPVKEAGLSMWIGPLVLGATGIVFGIVPDMVGTWLICPAVHAFHPSEEHIQMALYHGINPPLLLSAVTITTGCLLYLWRRPAIKGIAAIFRTLPADATGIYEYLLDGVGKVARFQTRIIQNGSLHRYLYVICAFFVFLAGFSYLRGGAVALPALWSNTPLPAADLGMLMLLIAVAAITVVFSRSVLLAICALGIMGAGIAMIFLRSGAPDLALTQLLVETLTVIIVAVILLRLPGLQKSGNSGFLKTAMNAVLAFAVGLMMTFMLLIEPGGPPNDSLTRFFEENSYVAAHGRNIVNVILVDFRGLDTMGEIIVVAAAALAGVALIRNRKETP